MGNGARHAPIKEVSADWNAATGIAADLGAASGWSDAAGAKDYGTYPENRIRHMLTKLAIRNFKRFSNVEIELGSPVVFIGPNNSGKTSAMQALALWNIGLKRWNEKRSGKSTPEKCPGVTVNRRDLVAMPIPDANLLWRDLHIRDVQVVDGKQQTSNLRVEIVVEGMANDGSWACGLEFDYANQESF